MFKENNMKTLNVNGLKVNVANSKVVLTYGRASVTISQLSADNIIDVKVDIPGECLAAKIIECDATCSVSVGRAVINDYMITGAIEEANDGEILTDQQLDDIRLAIAKGYAQIIIAAQQAA